MVDLAQERDVDTLRLINLSLLLERENQRLITKTLQLTAELARLRGVPEPEQLALAELRALEQRRAEVLAPALPPSPATTRERPPRPGHGPRSQPALPIVEIRHELPPDPGAGGIRCGAALAMRHRCQASACGTMLRMWVPPPHRIHEVEATPWSAIGEVPHINSSCVQPIFISVAPPGRYLAIAVAEHEAGEESNPELLQRFRPAPTPFTIAEGESRVLNLSMVVP